MAIDKILKVDAEFAALGDALASVLSDIKAKKSIGEDFSDALAILLPALSGLASFLGDVKKVDNQVYLIKCLADALEGSAPAPAPIEPPPAPAHEPAPVTHP